MDPSTSQEAPLPPNPEITRLAPPLDYILIVILLVVFLVLPTISYRRRRMRFDEYQKSKALEAGLVAVKNPQCPGEKYY